LRLTNGNASGLVVGHCLAALTGLCFRLQRDAGDLDRGGRRADLQGEVDVLAHTDGNADIICLGIGKAIGRGDNLIRAHTQRRHVVLAGAIRRSLRRDPRLCISDRYLCMRHRRARGVADRSNQTSIVKLGLHQATEK
jgi:hypothetical protein